MSLVIKIVLLFLFCLPFMGSAQVEEKERSFSGFQTYDESFITPELRRKNAISFGPVLGIHSAYFNTTASGELSDGGENFTPNGGIHLGYNYLILGKRNLKFSRKKRIRNEVKLSFGVHVHVLLRGEWMGEVNLYRPFIKKRGRLFSWDLFSGYSLGVHHLPNNLFLEKKVYFNAALEIFRLRFGKAPFYLNSRLNYDVTNNFLDKEKMYAGLLFGLRYDFYRNKIRK